MLAIVFQRGQNIRLAAQKQRGGKADIVAHQQYAVALLRKGMPQILRDGALSAAAAPQKANALCHQLCPLIACT